MQSSEAMRTARPDSESSSSSEAETPVRILRSPKAVHEDMAEAATFRGALTFSVRLGNGTLATGIGDFVEDPEPEEG